MRQIEEKKEKEPLQEVRLELKTYCTIPKSRLWPSSLTSLSFLHLKLKIVEIFPELLKCLK